MAAGCQVYLLGDGEGAPGRGGCLLLSFLLICCTSARSTPKTGTRYDLPRLVCAFAKLANQVCQYSTPISILFALLDHAAALRDQSGPTRPLRHPTAYVCRRVAANPAFGRGARSGMVMALGLCLLNIKPYRQPVQDGWVPNSENNPGI